MKSEINVDNLSIDELKKTIDSYQQNISQIDATIEIEEKNITLESNVKLKTLRTLKKDVQNAINYYKSALKFKEQEIQFNNDPITDKNIGKCASIYYEEDKKWYNGIINTVNTKDNVCNITYFGYNETADVPFKYVKVNKCLNPDELKFGFHCEAIHEEDGLWYDAIIERTSELGVHVIFDKFSNNECILPIDCIRITPQQNMENIKLLEEKNNKKVEKNDNKEDGEINNKEKKDEVKTSFVIPKELKVNPTDNDEVKFLKRKRVKQLKNKNKQRDIIRITTESQQKWLNFNKNLKGNNKTANGFSALKILPK